MFAAAKKYSEKSSEIFGKGFGKLVYSLGKKSSSSILEFLQISV